MVVFIIKPYLITGDVNDRDSSKTSTYQNKTVADKNTITAREKNHHHQTRNSVVNVYLSKLRHSLQLLDVSLLNNNEKWYVMFIQILIPFVIAGFGMVAAGVLLDYVQVMTV